MSSSLRSILAKVSNELSEITDKALQKLSGPPTNLNNGENLEALDSTAFRVNGKWVAEFVISVFERENRAGLEKVVNDVLCHIPGIKGDDIIWERLKYFVSVPVGNVKIVLRQEESQDVFTVGPTMHNGILSNEVGFPQVGNTWTQGDQVIFTVLAPPDFPGCRSFTMNFGEEEGVGIISGTHRMKFNTRYRRHDQNIRRPRSKEVTLEYLRQPGSPARGGNARTL
jgi:hypothetical protein